MINSLKNEWNKNKSVYIIDIIIITLFILYGVAMYCINSKGEMKVKERTVKYMVLDNGNDLDVRIFKDEPIKISQRNTSNNWSTISISLGELEKIVNAAKRFYNDD